MGFTVFFSWQSDHASTEGRNLIDRALEKAVGRIAADGEVEDAIREDLAVDKDTKGVPGSPPIVDTIFRKIDNAAVFVPDLTFVGTRAEGRPTPNPNVLIEYGWALRSLGHARIIPVMNVAHGEPIGDAMPFDMRHLRNPIQYNCPDGADEKTRAAARESLAKALEAALRTIFVSEEFRASLPRPLAPPPFPAAEPKDGRGRFRAFGEAIGYKHDLLRRLRPSQADDDGRIWLHGGSCMWLRLMPTSATDRSWRVTELEQVIRHQAGCLVPLNSERYSGFGFVHGEDGFGSYAVDHEVGITPAVAYVFSTGEVWMADTGVLTQTAPFNQLPFVEQPFVRAIENAAAAMGRLGLAPPYRWIAGIEGVRGRTIQYPPAPGRMNFPGDSGPTCTADIIEAEGTHVVGATTRQSLRPFFEKVFDMCGVVRPAHLDQ